MNTPLKDEEIAALYKQSATAEPSKALDDKILDYAKAQAAQGQPSTSSWWPYFGLAASVMLVVLLAPWRWLDQASDVRQESEFNGVRQEMADQSLPKPTASEAPVESLQKRSESAALMAPSRMKSAPALDAMEMRAAPAMTQAMAPEVELNPFAEVETLLAKGETDKATAALKQLLTQRPELKEKLPEPLKALLSEQAESD